MASAYRDAFVDHRGTLLGRVRMLKPRLLRSIGYLLAAFFALGAIAAGVRDHAYGIACTLAGVSAATAVFAWLANMTDDLVLLARDVAVFESGVEVTYLRRGRFGFGRTHRELFPWERIRAHDETIKTPDQTYERFTMHCGPALVFHFYARGLDHRRMKRLRELVRPPLAAQNASSTSTPTT